MILPVQLPSIGGDAAQFRFETLIDSPAAIKLRAMTSLRSDLNSHLVNKHPPSDVQNACVDYINGLLALAEVSKTIPFKRKYTIRWRSGLTPEVVVEPSEAKTSTQAIGIDITMTLFVYACSLLDQAARQFVVDSSSGEILTTGLDEVPLTLALQIAKICSKASTTFQTCRDTLTTMAAAIPELDPRVLGGLCSYSHLCGQICAFELAASRSGSKNLLAKLAMQVDADARPVQQTLRGSDGLAYLVNHVSVVGPLYRARANTLMASSEFEVEHFGIANAWADRAMAAVKETEAALQEVTAPHMRLIVGNIMSKVKIECEKIIKENRMVYYEPPPKEMPSVVPVSAIKRTPPGVPVRELLQLYKAPVPFAPDEFVLNVSDKSIQQLNTSETSGSARQTMFPNGVCTANENSYNGYMQGMQTTPTH
ncbi:hypothetical protein Pmar_PMAR005836 [Perkinsus marinus ATCC 50983]|uniref:BRO1 domain-containing protein n=1 Tax=Perkinsus marinus (strain ATCC 50983 / TXsc) TaxID=423536 RepID=C5KYC4_PERM5|nr:hypothetical protein Pmar_PMAR005836 [Perkinsus marinus ATCC 50983]EER10501.1 hypothetical protein Pmar_PMAR005836 [Perkinsus marinus ATCC 50983]|eukprot:XP_002778706.1 hypothetical protein Pmar_PMAR005836 [Perkinsus marinus ATCC 50983]